jgi:hypothetical protein
MEGPPSSRGIKNRHFTWHFTAHDDDDDDDDDDVFQFLKILYVERTQFYKNNKATLIWLDVSGSTTRKNQDEKRKYHDGWVKTSRLVQTDWRNILIIKDWMGCAFV